MALSICRYLTDRIERRTTYAKSARGQRSRTRFVTIGERREGESGPRRPRDALGDLSPAFEGVYPAGRAFTASERSAARLAHRSGGPGVGSSNLPAPTISLVGNPTSTNRDIARALPGRIGGGTAGAITIITRNEGDATIQYTVEDFSGQRSTITIHVRVRCPPKKKGTTGGPEVISIPEGVFPKKGEAPETPSSPPGRTIPPPPPLPPVTLTHRSTCEPCKAIAERLNAAIEAYAVASRIDAPTQARALEVVNRLARQLDDCERARCPLPVRTSMNMSFNPGGGFATLNLPDIHFGVKKKEPGGETVHKLSNDNNFGDEVGGVVTGELTLPLSGSTAIAFSGFWARIDGADTVRCSSTLDERCTITDIVDDPEFAAPLPPADSELDSAHQPRCR